MVENRSRRYAAKRAAERAEAWMRWDDDRDLARLLDAVAIVLLAASFATTIYMLFLA